MFVKNLTKLGYLFFGMVFVGLNSSIYRNPSVETAFAPNLFSSRKNDSNGLWLSFGYSTAESSYNEYGETGPLFSCFGPTDFYQLTKLHRTFTTNPKTDAFIKDVCANPQYSHPEQVLQLSGKAELIKCEANCFYDFKNGLSAVAQLPIMFSACKDLSFVSQSGSKTTFCDEVNKKINAVLTENGIEPLDKGYNACSFGDAKLGIVWSDKFKSSETWSWAKVDSVSMAIGAFLILPTSTYSKNKKQFLYAIPTGDGGNFGVSLQMDSEVSFKDNLFLIVSGESKVFLQQNSLIRPKLFAEQTGMLLTKPEHLWFDNGHYWKLFAGLKIEVPKLRTHFFGGYFYESKEASSLSMSDQAINSNTSYDLVTEFVPKDKTSARIYWDNTAQNFANEQPAPTTLHNSILSSERSLQRQYAHWMCFGIGFKSERERMKGKEQDLTISLSYGYPIFGKNRFIFTNWSGVLMASTTLNF